MSLPRAPHTLLRRPLALLSARASPRPTTTAHVRRISIGARLPSAEGHPARLLMHGSPGNKVDLAAEVMAVAKGKGTGGKALVIGVPGAFSPACSGSHVPGYISHERLKDAGQVFVVAVNDPFVMKAWAESLDPEERSGIRFLADPTAAFTKALELDFDDAAPIFGGVRSKRYAMELTDGRVTKLHVEPDNTGMAVSTAAKVLGDKA